MVAKGMTPLPPFRLSVAATPNQVDRCSDRSDLDVST